MNITIKLEKIEEEALETISTANCEGIGCLSCPFKYRDYDINLCIRAVCQHLLEDYRNKEN